jgi:hypothetical protein
MKRGQARWSRAAAAFAALCMGLAVSGCGGAPRALGGMWSSSPAACAAGLGVTFKSDAVRARFDQDGFVLLAQPRYQVRQTPWGAVFSITYALPDARTGRDSGGDWGVGVIELKWSRQDARLAPYRRRYLDLRTGAANVPLRPDAVDRALALTRCPKRPVPDELALAD